MGRATVQTRDGSRARRALELRMEGKTYRQIAAVMSVSYGGAAALVRYARERGDTMRSDGECDDEHIDTTPGCGRCGLRGEHGCLPTSAAAYLGRDGDQSFVRNRAA